MCPFRSKCFCKSRVLLRRCRVNGKRKWPGLIMTHSHKNEHRTSKTYTVSKSLRSPSVMKRGCICLKEKGEILVCFLVDFSQGLARTQTPILINCVPELPTFGVIASVNPTEVQWNVLFLGEPPFVFHKFIKFPMYIKTRWGVNNPIRPTPLTNNMNPNKDLKKNVTYRDRKSKKLERRLLNKMISNDRFIKISCKKERKTKNDKTLTFEYN